MSRAAFEIRKERRCEVSPLCGNLSSSEQREEVMAGQVHEPHSPVGTWKVLSFQIQFEDSDERVEPYGANPLGHVVITGDRLIAVITGSERASDASAGDLFASMMAY